MTAFAGRVAAATILVLLGLSPAGPALAQGADVAFGGLKMDTSLPVEVAADQLQISQSDGSATFTGNVEIAQGEMRLSAGKVLVIYGQGGAGSGQIQEMQASGGVTLVNNGEAAEAEEAVYNIDRGEVVMTGEVLLTQGQNALSSNRLVIDLTQGTGSMEGRVRTIFQPGQN